MVCINCGFALLLGYMLFFVTLFICACVEGEPLGAAVDQRMGPRRVRTQARARQAEAPL